MRSAKEILKKLFKRQCQAIKPIHLKKPEFHYVFNEEGPEREPFIFCPVRSNTGGMTERDIVFRVASQDDFKSAVLTKNVFEGRINDVFTCIMSDRLMRSTLNEEDREKLDAIRRIKENIEKIKLTGLQLAETINSVHSKSTKHQYGTNGTYAEDSLNCSLEGLCRDVDSRLNPDYKYEIKSFILDGDNIEVNVVFQYHSKNQLIYTFSKTPIKVVINLNDFNSEVRHEFIDKLSKAVNAIINDLAGHFPDGSPEFKMAFESSNKGESLGAYKKEFKSFSISIF